MPLTTNAPNDSLSLIRHIPAGGMAARPRERLALTVDGIGEIADQLLRGGDPSAAAPHLVAREVPHFYVPEIHGPVQQQIYHAVAARTPLFVQGAAEGVGASMLTLDYSRAYNQRARERGEPGRMVYMRLWGGTNTVKSFLDALSTAVQAPATLAELRARGAGTLGERILQAARMLRVRAIIVDHVHNAGEELRGTLGDLMMAADPAYSVSLSGESAREDERISVILVDHEPPELLFRRAPHVLGLLRGRYASLPRYGSAREVAEALRAADIGLDDIDCNDPDDLAMAATVFDATDGLVTTMAGLIGTIDLFAAVHGWCRPDRAIVHGALQYHRRMIGVLSERGEAGDEHLKTMAAPFVSAEQLRARRRKASRGTAKERSRSRGAAEAERKDMLRREYSVLPEQPR